MKRPRSQSQSPSQSPSRSPSRSPSQSRSPSPSRSQSQSRSPSPSRAGRGPLVAFLGPSLPAAEALALAPGALLLPPARQGDVWRALALRPRAIALIDGVFESQPSVWHHEVLDALDAGVPVVGGASMGALRAAELHGHGMQGAGQIFRWYRDGTLIDDADVALLHADAEHSFRPLTVPQVNVRHAAALARRARVLRPAEAAALVETSAGIFYQARTWPVLVDSLPAQRRAPFQRWLAAERPDLKASDAREVLSAARRARPREPAPREPAPSSLVRLRRLREGASATPEGELLPNEEILAALDARPDAALLADAGLRRALLASFARAAGLRPTAAELAAARSRWLESLGVPKRDAAAFHAASGLSEADARRLCEELALERLALASAARLVPGGPGRSEAFAAEARVRGHWAAAVRRGR